MSLQCQYTPLLTACEYKKVDIVKLLLKLPTIDVSVVAKSNVLATVSDHQRGRTALHIAATHNCADIVDILVKKKCPLSVQDQYVRLSSVIKIKIKHHEFEYMCSCTLERK